MNFLKTSLPKRKRIKNLKKEVQDAKDFIENAENAKANFGDNQSLKRTSSF